MLSEISLGSLTSVMLALHFEVVPARLPAQLTQAQKLQRF
jgi:hypothetical protein